MNACFVTHRLFFFFFFNIRYGFDFILCPVISRDEYRRFSFFKPFSPFYCYVFFVVFFHSESVVTPLLARTRSQSSCVCVEHHQSDNRKRGKLCEMLGKQKRARGPGDWYPSDLRLYIYTTSHTTAQVIRFQLLFPPFFSFFILFFFLFRLSYVNINQHAMGFSSIGQVLACI